MKFISVPFYKVAASINCEEDSTYLSGSVQENLSEDT